jgi:hypothetical protein
MMEEDVDIIVQILVCLSHNPINLRGCVYDRPQYDITA